MGSPLVSVHVVTYNQREFIEETVESAVSQDYPALELVVSDDGSTDGTADLVCDLERRHPGQVVAIVGGPNLGITGNGNRCLARCTGKYVAFLAGDDLMLPGKIRAQVDWLEADPERVLCSHDVEHFDSTTGRTSQLHSSLAKQRSGAGIAEFLRRGYYSATSSIMVRASAMPARGFDERIRVHSDWKFAADCLLGGGKFGYVPGVYGRYRRHEGNATTRHADLMWQELHIGLAAIEAEHPELVGACEAARAYAYEQRAVGLVQEGRTEEARRAMRNALRHHPAPSWKLPVWWAISLAPRHALPHVVQRRFGLR